MRSRFSCVATAGVRRATNGERLVELIASACGGLETEILTGRRGGAACVHRRRLGGWGRMSGTLAVVDAGGGSCELAVGERADRVRWWESVPDRLQ